MAFARNQNASCFWDLVRFLRGLVVVFTSLLGGAALGVTFLVHPVNSEGYWIAGLGIAMGMLFAEARRALHALEASLAVATLYPCVALLLRSLRYGPMANGVRVPVPALSVRTVLGVLATAVLWWFVARLAGGRDDADGPG